ncbi:MAG: HIT domain-containing protein [Nitriliruptorales bacterium]
MRTASADQPPPLDGLQRLWAPWRSGYIAGGGRIEGCPFCVLPARGREYDRENLILFRGEHCFVIFNAYPYNPGHVMVVPFAHLPRLGELDEATAGELWRLGRRAAVVLTERLGADGINLGMNLGGAAGAGISDHLHLHAVPRWVGDTNFVSVVGATRILPRALDEMYDELAPGFAELDEDRPRG